MDQKNGLQRKISMEPRKGLFPVIEIMLAVTIIVGCRQPSMIFGAEGDSTRPFAYEYGTGNRVEKHCNPTTDRDA